MRFPFKSGVSVAAIVVCLLSTFAASQALSADAATLLTPECRFSTQKQNTSVMQLVQSNDCFTSISRLLKVSGLDEILHTRKGVTLLAPPDSALAALPQGEFEALLEDSALLRSTLENHVIPYGILIYDMLESRLIPSIANDTPLIFEAQTGRGFAVNDVPILQADIQASNGFLCVVGGLVMPRNEPELIEEIKRQREEELRNRLETRNQVKPPPRDGRSFSTAITRPPAQRNLFYCMNIMKRFTAFSDCVIRARMTPTLQANPGPWTLLLPTDDAMAAAMERLNQLHGDEQAEAIETLVNNHLVSGRIALNSESQTLLSRSGSQVIASNQSIQDQAVLEANIEAGNGVIHILDGVLWP